MVAVTSTMLLATIVLLRFIHGQQADCNSVVATYNECVVNELWLFADVVLAEASDCLAENDCRDVTVDLKGGIQCAEKLVIDQVALPLKECAVGIDAGGFVERMAFQFLQTMLRGHLPYLVGRKKRAASRGSGHLHFKRLTADSVLGILCTSDESADKAKTCLRSAVNNVGRQLMDRQHTCADTLMNHRPCLTALHAAQCSATMLQQRADLCNCSRQSLKGNQTLGSSFAAGLRTCFRDNDPFNSQEYLELGLDRPEVTSKTGLNIMGQINSGLCLGVPKPNRVSKKANNRRLRNQNRFSKKPRS